MIQAIAVNISKDCDEASRLLPYACEGSGAHFYDYAAGEYTATVVTTDEVVPGSPNDLHFIPHSISQALEARGQGGSVVSIESLGPTNPVILGVAIRLAKIALK